MSGHTLAPNVAAQELASDYGRDLCQCHKCSVFHFNSDTSCPDCGAGYFWQCWTEKGNTDKPVASHENYAKAYASRAQRLRRQADAADERAQMHRDLTTTQGAPHD